MALHQYVGARYVTKIYENSLDPSSAEWEAGVNYEPLTLVTYNYGSYLSKKEVPGSIGDPASEPTYWAQTGFYNGQISALQAAIDAINDKIGNILFIDAMTGATDTDKVQAALDECGNNEITYIVATRLYDIQADLDVKIKTSYGRMYVIGIGEHAGFKMNGHKFYSTGGDRSYGGGSFDHITFWEDTEHTTEVVFDCDTMIRTRFSNCLFYKCGTIMKSTSYIQDAVFNMCSFMNCYQLIDGTDAFMIQISDCEVEVMRNDLVTLTGTINCFGCRGSILESIHGHAFKFGYPKGASIMNNYFEDFTDQSKYIIDMTAALPGSSVDISDNFFGSAYSGPGDTVHQTVLVGMTASDTVHLRMCNNAAWGSYEVLCEITGTPVGCRKLIATGNNFSTLFNDTTPSSLPVSLNSECYNGTTMRLGVTYNLYVAFNNTGFGRVLANIPTYGRTYTVTQMLVGGTSLNISDFSFSDMTSDLTTVTSTDPTIVAAVSDKVVQIDIIYS